MELTYDKCTVEQAKRLKELGVKQESQFYYCPWKATDYNDVFVGQKCDKGFYHEFEGAVETFSPPPEIFSAFTTGELGEMLPREVYSFKLPIGTWSLMIEPVLFHRMQVCVVKYGYNKFPTEAQVRADVLIYLLEQVLMPRPQFITGEDMIRKLGLEQSLSDALDRQGTVSGYKKLSRWEELKFLRKQKFFVTRHLIEEESSLLQGGPVANLDKEDKIKVIKETLYLNGPEKKWYSDPRRAATMGFFTAIAASWIFKLSYRSNKVKKFEVGLMTAQDVGFMEHVTGEAPPPNEGATKEDFR